MVGLTAAMAPVQEQTWSLFDQKSPQRYAAIKVILLI